MWYEKLGLRMLLEDKLVGEEDQTLGNGKVLALRVAKAPRYLSWRHHHSNDTPRGCNLQIQQA